MLSGLSDKVKRRLLIAVTLWACLWLCGILVALILYIQLEAKGPLQSQTEIRIPNGSSVAAISALLEEQGVIRSAKLFKILYWLTLADRTLKAGTFRIPQHASMKQTMLILYKGIEVLYPVTIAEGLTIKETITVLVREGIGTETEYQAIVRDQEFLRELGIDAGSFEGFWFPETYNVLKGITPRQMVTLMVRRFQTVFEPEWLSAQDTEHLTKLQIVTLASLIEKEAARAEERPLVSRVYRNRLAAKMLLQCDPTVIYALPNFNGNITKADLQIDSPYNTYRYRGLPPGPICNPSQGSLQAALFPADGDWLYFVARKDGTHEFNVTLEEHNRAVYRHQIRRPR